MGEVLKFMTPDEGFFALKKFLRFLQKSLNFKAFLG